MDDNVLRFKGNPDLGLTSIQKRVYAILESTHKDVKWLAEMFDVSEQTIRNIKTLKTQRSIEVAAIMRAAGIEPVLWEQAPRFSKQQVDDIRASSVSSSKLAEIFGCAPSTIRMIKTGKTYV